MERKLTARVSVLQKDLMLRAWRAGLKTGLYYLRTLHPASMESVDDPVRGSSASRAVDCCT